ncbi:flagellar hook-associated protein 2 [Bacillus sp. 37MA]|uniref:flagellar hook-associated protein 2 n=1 Tax=Bacillus sp. 37MA TaxID=1132442 RepID=UPI00036CC49D|nr:flagellar hook-associated protein 2 [Bacillus sp. 37MA]
MVMRVGGLASGMDIDSIVKNLMTAERMPLDKLKQKKQVLEWQRDDYRSMNTLLLDFRTELTQMKLTTKYRARTTTSSDETKVSATATSAASQASYSISEVKALAKAENWVTGSIGSVDGTKELAAQVPGFTKWLDGAVGSKTLTQKGTDPLSLGVDAGTIQEAEFAKMSVKVNGVSYQMVGLGDTFDSTKNQAKIDKDGNITFSHTIEPNSTVKVDYISVAQNGEKYADFSIAAKSSKGDVKENFLISSTETLNQVVNKVNSSNAGVSMFYDTVTNKISLMQKETGDFNEGNGNLSVAGDLAIDVLRLDSAAKTLGGNAVFTINGLETNRPSNTFDMNGVSITLKKTFDANEGAATLSINNDGSAVYDNIKSFVDKYNTLIGAISSKTSEEKYRSYTPLTDDQREQLSDKQQEQWEEKAKSGLLRRDSILTGVLTNMRSNFSQPISNSTTDPMFKQLASIGITTTANYLEGGKLEINEAKLKEAINNNPDAVEALFRGGGDSSVASEKGIVHRLYDTVNATMDKLKERAGNTFSTNQQFALGRQLSNIDSSITRFESRLVQVEDRYWRQFTAMEKAIQQANSQSNYLMQQFSM